MRYRQPSQLQEDRAVEASLARENDFWDRVHFPEEHAKREGNGRSLEAEPRREAREEAEMDARTEREEAEAERLHDTDPGRWGDHASPARMRRDIERDRENDRGY